jgi:hypothetical protein
MPSDSLFMSSMQSGVDSLSSASGSGSDDEGSGSDSGSGSGDGTERRDGNTTDVA